MSDEDPDNESFEEKLKAFARELSESMEQAAERLDLEGMADQIVTGGERLRDLAQFAGQWLNDQFGDEPMAPGKPEPDSEQRLSGRRLSGPHPLDVPTEAQGLALSALASGRWTVKPGTSDVSATADGTDPEATEGVVGELRARDWIASSGELTALGQRALRRWSERSAE
jgi:hypothetical protein